MNGRILRQDRNASFTLNVVGIHHPLRDLLVFTKSPALLEHLVDQRCLAVIDVRDDRYVSDILSLHSIPSIPFAFFESTESKNCKFHFDTPIIFDRYK